MRKKTLVRFGTSASLTLTAALATAQFHPNPKLRVGDPAPAITVHTWLRGHPTTVFQKGKVYVVDFWATWCGGCIASFPHISAIADKYKGKVTFLSVDSYEDLGKKDAPDPQPKVTDFLKTPQGRNLTLNVCMDGNSSSPDSMFGNWVEPLHRTGFPTTFVVDQEGRIAWVDVNLDQLDWVLAQVTASTWDRDKARAIEIQADALEDKWLALFRAKDAAQAKIAQALLDGSEAFKSQFPDRSDVSDYYEAFAYEVLDPEKLPPILDDMAANPLTRYVSLSDVVAFTMMQKRDLSKAVYTALARDQERMLQNQFPQAGYGGKSVRAYETLASTYDKAGEPDSAASNQEKAISMARDLKAPSDQIEKLQKTLNRYNSK